MGRETGSGVRELVDRINGLVRQGNVRRVTVRNGAGRVLLDIPVTAGVTAGALAVMMAPLLAAGGAVLAVAGRWTIDVEHTDQDQADGGAGADPADR